MKNVAVIGVGRMGGPMAGHAQRGGFNVVVHDVSPAMLDAARANGLRSADSIAAAMHDAHFVITMLPSDEALHQAMQGQDGILAHVQPGQIVIDMSTSKVASSQHFAQALAAAGGHFLDAPVSGGTGGAQNASLSIMVGGAPAAFAAAEPLLRSMGSNVTHIGANGMGLVAKYVNQMVMGAEMLIIAEAFAFAAKSGADLNLVFQAVRHGLAGSRMLEQMVPMLLSDDYGEGRELTLHHKDEGYALAAGAGVGAHMPSTELSHSTLQAAMDAGLGAHHGAAIAKLFGQG